MHFWREHGEEIKDCLGGMAIVVPSVIIGNCLTPPEFLRVAIWRYLVWSLLG